MGRTSKAAASLSPDSSAGEVVLAHARNQARTVHRLSEGVRAHEPEAIHKTRVATRRLRTTLRVFRRLLDSSRSEELRAELRWYAHYLGPLRDVDVVRPLLLAHLTDLPTGDQEAVRHRIEVTLDEARREYAAELDEVLASPRYADLVAALDHFVSEPPWRGRAGRSAARVLPGLVRDAARRVHRTHRQARLATDPEERRTLRHEIRKRAKAVRYAHEALAGAFGEGSRDRAEDWETLTEVLGEDQDRVTAHAWVDRIVAEARAADEEVAPFAGLRAALDPD